MILPLPSPCAPIFLRIFPIFPDEGIFASVPKGDITGYAPCLSAKRGSGAGPHYSSVAHLLGGLRHGRRGYPVSCVDLCLEENTKMLPLM